MKRLFILENCLPGLIRSFEAEGFEVRQIEFSYMIKEGIIPDYCFTFDYDIKISQWCIDNEAIYICWIFDSPHIPLYKKIATDEHNKIFLFDRSEYTYLKKCGRKNVFHLPLATDVMFLYEQTQNSDFANKKYHDVSFMGNLYDNNMYDSIEYLPDELRGYVEGLFQVQMQLWGTDIFKSFMLYDFENKILDFVKLDLGDDYFDDVVDVFFDTMLCKKIAQLERHRMCDTLCSKYDFVLYSASDTSYNKKILNAGYLDYIHEMPKMFYQTKININNNLHCISSGIPLRVLDSLACGGF